MRANALRWEVLETLPPRRCSGGVRDSLISPIWSGRRRRCLHGESFAFVCVGAASLAARRAYTSGLPAERTANARESTRTLRRAASALVAACWCRCRLAACALFLVLAPLQRIRNIHLHRQ